jgi:hypothetical protein
VTVETVSDVLDFGAHGDDILFKLFLIIQCVTAMASQSAKPSTVSIYWQTSAAEAMSNAVETLLTPTALGDSACALKAFVVANHTLPRNLKRYNRLKFVLTPYDSGGTRRIRPRCPRSPRSSRTTVKSLWTKSVNKTFPAVFQNSTAGKTSPGEYTP